MLPMADEPVVVTRVYKRGVCWYVEGTVVRRGEALKAAFTVLASDVEHMTRDQFHAFAVRRLPEVTEAERYEGVPV